MIGVGHVHDEQVLVAIAQYGVVGVVALEVFIPERFRYPGHEDVVDADEVQAMASVGALAVVPPIPPAGGEDAAVKLGPVL